MANIFIGGSRAHRLFKKKRKMTRWYAPTSPKWSEYEELGLLLKILVWRILYYGYGIPVDRLGIKFKVEPDKIIAKVPKIFKPEPTKFHKWATRSKKVKITKKGKKYYLIYIEPKEK